MRKRRQKKVVERDILKDLIDAGLGHLRMSDLETLSRLFERPLTMKIIHKGKVISEFNIGG